MSSKFRILQQNDGTTVFPITRAEGIYFKDNTTFNKLSFFPVGAIYISAQDTSPSQLFGGVWEKIEEYFFLVVAHPIPMDLLEEKQLTHYL